MLKQALDKHKHTSKFAIVVNGKTYELRRNDRKVK